MALAHELIRQYALRMPAPSALLAWWYGPLIRVDTSDPFPSVSIVYAAIEALFGRSVPVAAFPHARTMLSPLCCQRTILQTTDAHFTLLLRGWCDACDLDHRITRAVHAMEAP